MTATDQYHDRIARATQRLAQLQARSLLANQRRAAKERELARREQAKRSQRIAALVTLAGADSLPDAELLGTLLIHLDVRLDESARLRAMERGASRLHAEYTGRPQPKH